MRVLTLFAFCWSVMWMPVSVNAEDGGSPVYYGLSIGNGDLDVGGTPSVTEDLKNISAVLGFHLDSFISFELRGGLGSSEDSSLLNDPMATHAGGFLRLSYEGDNVIAYALGGAGKVDVKRGTVRSKDDGAAFGVGVALFGNDTTALDISAVKYGDDYTVYSFGYQHYFGGY